MKTDFEIALEDWPVRGEFRISREVKTRVPLVTVTLQRGNAVGRGEGAPLKRYGESAQSAAAMLEALRAPVEAGLDRASLQNLAPPCAARNALDCALWDLEAKSSGRPVYEIAGLAPPRPVTTAFTLSIDAPEAMAAAALASAHKLLKLKLAGDDEDEARIKAVRAARPDARLIVDANEALAPAHFQSFMTACALLNVEMVEQPFPAGADAALENRPKAPLLCADESLHGDALAPSIKGRYDRVNIKLDKTGGLTGALALMRAAEQAGLGVMLGCMVATSLSMAPAMLLAGRAALVDLDGAALLAQDRTGGLRYEGGRVYPAAPAFWG